MIQWWSCLLLDGFALSQPGHLLWSQWSGCSGQIWGLLMVIKKTNANWPWCDVQWQNTRNSIFGRIQNKTRILYLLLCVTSQLSWDLAATQPGHLRRHLFLQNRWEGGGMGCSVFAARVGGSSHTGMSQTGQANLRKRSRFRSLGSTNPFEVATSLKNQWLDPFVCLNKLMKLTNGLILKAILSHEPQKTPI